MASIVEEIKEWLRRLEEKFHRGERSGRVLTLLAALRLHRRGEKITAESVAREAHRIMEETPGTDWGVSREEYTVEMAAELLRELARLGILEEVEGGYIMRKYESLDPAAEVYARFGHLIFWGGPAR